MRFNNTDDDAKSDFFDGPDIDTAEESKPQYKPDDPRYWDDEESQWEHLKPRHRGRIWLWVACVAAAIALVCAVWVRFFKPYITEATQYGYIESVEKRGSIFRTYEGVLIPYKDIMDDSRGPYQRDFIFTTANDALGEKLQEMQLTATPVRVKYEVYYATVPWRGASKIIVTQVDTADVSKILPPDFTPPYYRYRHDATDTLEASAKQAALEADEENQ